MHKVILPPSDTESLFRFVVYFNYNHHETGTQVIKIMRSYDLPHERANGHKAYPYPLNTDWKGLEQWNGIKAFAQWMAKMTQSHRIWSALVTSNRHMDEDGRPRLLLNLTPNPQPPKYWKSAAEVHPVGTGAALQVA